MCLTPRSKMTNLIIFKKISEQKQVGKQQGFYKLSVLLDQFIKICNNEKVFGFREG